MRTSSLPLITLLLMSVSVQAQSPKYKYVGAPACSNPTAEAHIYIEGRCAKRFPQLNETLNCADAVDFSALKHNLVANLGYQGHGIHFKGERAEEQLKTCLNEALTLAEWSADISGTETQERIIDRVSQIEKLFENKAQVADASKE